MKPCCRATSARSGPSGCPVFLFGMRSMGDGVEVRALWWRRHGAWIDQSLAFADRSVSRSFEQHDSSQQSAGRAGRPVRNVCAVTHRHLHLTSGDLPRLPDNSVTCSSITCHCHLPYPHLTKVRNVLQAQSYPSSTPLTERSATVAVLSLLLPLQQSSASPSEYLSALRR